MKLSAIKQNPNNPREIRGEQFARLKKSVQDFPQMMALRPIIIDSEGVVLGGNMRLQALKALKFKEIPDEWVKRADELTEEQKREFIVKDNAGFGEWDWDALANEWSDLPLAEWGVNLPDEWLNGNGHKEEDESKVTELVDRAAELQTIWGTELGQLWQIGKHRLLVGDCTEKANVARLCGDNRLSLLATDPPYGVDYVAKARDMHRSGYGHSHSAMETPIESDELKGEALSAFIAAALEPALDFAADGCGVYVWHQDARRREFMAALDGLEIFIHQIVIWLKPNFVIGRCNYHHIFEPCFHGWPKGKRPEFYGERNQTNVWEIARENDKVHPTQKPVDLFTRPILNHTLKGEIVYEPFGGTGTQFVAAEETGRVCYGLEIDPKYCAVTLERLSALGLTPSLQQ